MRAERFLVAAVLAVVVLAVPAVVLADGRVVRRSAAQGDANGQANFGWMYENGRGVSAV